MPIYKKDQQLPAQPVIVMIYGDPGTSKTSLSNTCANPLNIDFDRGFKRSYGRPDVLVLSNGWKEVEEELAAGTMDNYDTIVIDTAKGALDDFLMSYVIEKDYKLKTNKLRAFGELGEQFKAFVNVLRLKGKDLFIIAHAKNQEDGDVIRKVADVTGSSNALLLRISDQVGYLSMRNGKRVLSFNPTDLAIGKNVASLPDMELPLNTSPEWEDFAGREIVQKVKDALVTMTEEQRQSLELISGWRVSIDSLSGDDNTILAKEITETYAEIAKLTPEHLKKQISVYFLAHLKKIGWKWDKTVGEGKGAFVNTKAVVAEPVQPEIKPVEPVKADEPVITPVVDESNPSALNPGPKDDGIEGMTIKEDLFAKTE